MRLGKACLLIVGDLLSFFVDKGSFTLEYRDNGYRMLCPSVASGNRAFQGDHSVNPDVDLARGY
ncbi:uncharacterized protein APUU_60155A [Aspergillus puulaauensis]|uniref:Uncharacterized protein n=1 Tax=Aspergillus puulaauensis TaxID=1220207 RepID=A0A7R7XTI6_9EURO|nr:uncharacterized protein APUU_60155A [Aspergillus puulaauensis]BCS27107.1 hypothetical protein APUU_60155A [Aspergillus puulaauensis]